MKQLLIDATPVIKALELTTKSVMGGDLIGSYKSRFRGRGIEFEEYSEFVIGEDAEFIDWKASVRANKLLVKEFSEERNINVFFLIDVGNSMIYTTGKKLKAEYAGELVISLAFLMIKNGDTAGYAMFNDKILKRVPPAGGLTQYYYIIEGILNPQNYGGGHNLGAALKSTFEFLRPNTMVIIISDFIGMTPGWQEILKQSAQKFDIIAFMIRDPADSALPMSKREIILKDPYSTKKIHIRSEKVRQKYEQYVKQQEADLADFFTSQGISFLKLDTSKSFVELVIRFFRERKKRLRWWK